MILILFLIVLYLAIPIFKKKYPYANQTEGVLDSTEKIYYNDEHTSKIIIYLGDYVKGFNFDPTKLDIYV